MCRFFSFLTDGNGKPLYCDAKARAELQKNSENLDPDSHTSIAYVNGYKGAAEDTLNKYEYNPLTGKFSVDQINGANDSKLAEVWVRELDFSTVVPELIIKPIVHPFRDRCAEVTKEDIENLEEWDSVYDSVRDSVWDSVSASVVASVSASVVASVWASVVASVNASVRDSVSASVGDSVSAYISSFFHLQHWSGIEHEPGKNPFQSCINLWERGLVPSYDGTTWRLHSRNGIMFEKKEQTE